MNVAQLLRGQLCCESMFKRAVEDTGKQRNNNVVIYANGSNWDVMDKIFCCRRPRCDPTLERFRRSNIPNISASSQLSETTCTNDRMPSANFGLSGIGSPSSSMGGSILKVCNTEATVIQTAASPKFLPGQALYIFISIGRSTN